MSIVVKYPIRNYLFSVMVKLMYCCGLRPWEPRRLRVCDVDLKKGRLNIMDSKQHRSRIVMMSDDVTKLLIECDKKVSAVKSEREAFFHSYRGNFYAKYGMEEVFRNTLRETGIAGNNGHNPRLYNFRHTFATHRLYQWMREGKYVQAMIPYLSAYMGHSQISSTYYYRTCPHRVNVRIFRHNFVGDKAKIRRRAVALQGFLRQHRTEIAAQIRSQIFRQIVQKFCRHTDVCQGICVQDAGKYASRCATKPSGGLCAVLP